MPALLTDTYLADPFVPLAWRGVLEDLQAFLECERRLRELDRPANDDEQAVLKSLHDRLVARSGDLLEPTALDNSASPEMRRLLMRSVLALVHLKQVVVAEQPVLDTAGSRTLPLFEADFFGAPENVSSLTGRAQAILELSDTEVIQEQDTMANDLRDAWRKQAIVKALRDEFQLWPDANQLREGIGRFFRTIYPDAPIPAEEVEVIVTGTLVFFCLPLTKDSESLTTERFARLPSHDRAETMAFLRRLKRFTQERFGSFPAFGLVECDRIDSAFAARLADRSGVAVEEVLEELPRLVTILPQTEIEKYLIHDVWGHGWQASMLHFDDLYEQIAEFADPLEIGERTTAPSGGLPTLADCFTGAGEMLCLDATRFRDFATGEVCRRLPVALSAVLAEMLADVAEFKFLAEHPDRAAWLPSTSRLWTYPAMLDLTLADVPFYFSQATKAFRLWAKQPERQARCIAQLVGAGAAPAAATRAVVQAIDVWRQMEADYFCAELRWTVAGDRLQVNAYTRVLLNFVGLHRTLLSAYRELSAESTGSLPLKSFRDLLVLAASVFFEADPPRNLWRVDEFLALALAPFCRQLAEAGAQGGTD